VFSPARIRLLKTLSKTFGCSLIAWENVRPPSMDSIMLAITSRKRGW